MIKIVTDSSSDILQAEAKERGIILIPLTITFEDGKSYIDEIEITGEEFYRKLAESKKPPTTSQIPLTVLEDVYEQARKDGDILLVMPLSSQISGSYNTAVMVKKQGNYDNVHVIDTLETVGPLKLLVFEAAEKSKSMNIEDLKKHIINLQKRVRLMAMIDTLEFLRKGGRLSRASAFIGGLLHVKPIIGIVDGKIPVIAKTLGPAKAIELIKSKIQEFPIDPNYPVFFQYSTTKDKTIQLIDAVSDNPEKAKSEIFRIGPVVGTHIGPGAMSICYVTTNEKAYNPSEK